MVTPSKAHLESIIFDVFLPLQLPSRSRGQAHEDDLIASVLDSVKLFRPLAKENMREAVSIAQDAIINFGKTRNHFGDIDHGRLRQLLELAKADCKIPSVPSTATQFLTQEFPQHSSYPSTSNRRTPPSLSAVQARPPYSKALSSLHPTRWSPPRLDACGVVFHALVSPSNQKSLRRQISDQLQPPPSPK